MSVIQYGEGNTSGVLTPLIPFNCLIDTDFGLLALISKSYLDTSIFNIEFFNENKEISKLVKSLYFREEENPLSICLLDNNYANDLYTDFMNQKYDDILKVSLTTEVYNVIELYKIYGDIRPTIVYKTESEKRLLDHLKVTKTTQKIQIDEVNFDLYNQFYFKSVNDNYCNKISKYVNTKMVYIANYKFNLDSDNNVKENKNTLLMNINRNKFMLFDIYNRSTFLEI